MSSRSQRHAQPGATAHVRKIVDRPAHKKSPAVVGAFGGRPATLVADRTAAAQEQSKRKDRAAPGATAGPGGTVASGPPLSAAEWLAAGKALRERVPRASQGSWKRDKAKVDPLEILRASEKYRVERLLPIRYGRMLQSPFTFYRGSAAVMAADLSRSPSTGVHVHACGDCHLLNFGGFATPERSILFDINDFDETLPAPWEWDVKRLVCVLRARRAQQRVFGCQRTRHGGDLRAHLSQAPARVLGDEPA